MRPRSIPGALWSSAFASLVACTGGFTAPGSISYAPETGVDISRMERQETGLYVEDLTTGWGDQPARRGDAVKIHYIGLFPDGRKFDSSIDQGETMDFRIGLGEVIRAWEEGVIGMKVGGRRRLVVPPELGYGARGLPDLVPPDQVLVFEIQLVELN
jgi:FKBP-type peptidyl-prolyl cis-trans isomerase